MRGCHAVLPHPRLEHWRCRPALGRTHAAPGALGCHKRRCRADWLAKRGASTLSRSLSLVSERMRRCRALLTLQSTTLALLGVGLLNYLIGFNFGIVQRAWPTCCQIACAPWYPRCTSRRPISSRQHWGRSRRIFNDHVFHNPARIALSLRLVVPSAFLLGPSPCGMCYRPIARSRQPRQTLARHNRRARLRTPVFARRLACRPAYVARGGSFIDADVKIDAAALSAHSASRLAHRKWPPRNTRKLRQRQGREGISQGTGRENGIGTRCWQHR